MSDLLPLHSKKAGIASKMTIPTVNTRHSPSSQPTSTQVASLIKHSDTYSDEMSVNPRPEFQPFFTLVSDIGTSTTHHPTQIHYVFADDDPELITAACVDAINSASTTRGFSTTQGLADSSGGNSSTGSRAQHTGPGRENRIVLLDVDETGSRVVNAQSLSPTWQILTSKVSLAPTWDGAQLDNANMMLKIEGTDGSMLRNESGRGNREKEQDAISESNTDISEDDMYALMQEFDKRMLLLRTVIGNNTLSVL